MSDAVLDPTIIVARAIGEAKRLSAATNWSPAFAGASAQTPLLVKLLDAADSYYTWSASASAIA